MPGIRISKGAVCKICKKPLRKANSRLADYPGTVRHAGKMMCDVCIKKPVPALQKRLEDITAEERAVASAVARYVPREEWSEIAAMLGISGPTISQTQLNMALAQPMSRNIAR